MAEKHDIINRYLDNMYGADEIEQMQQLIRSEVGSEYLDERMREFWIECLDSATTGKQDKESLRREALRLIERTKQSRTKQKKWRIPAWTKVAASVLFLVATSLTVYFVADDRFMNTDVVYHELKVPFGQKEEITLADGSRVVLNAGSIFRYPERFTQEERNVYLDGEALFSVTSNIKQPFIVTSTNMAIKVLGTEFNVRTYGEDELAAVSVKSGKVQVMTEEMTTRLTSGDHITLNNRTKDFQKNKVELKSISYWVKGGLAFHETPIRDVAKELTRIYNHKIHFEKGQSFNNLIIGEHDNKSLEAVLKSIEYTSGIKFRKEGDDYILYKE